jgi:DNA-binding beta-propeller fold protein YncE
MKPRLLIISCGLLLLARTLMAQAETVKQFDMGTIRPKGGVFDINLAGDKVIVPDLSNALVVVLDRDMNKVREIRDNVTLPHGVAVDKDGYIYIGMHRKNGIVKLRPDLSEIKGWDKALLEHMQSPVALEAGLSNNLYVCDWLLQRVIEVTTDGKFVRVFEDGPIKAKAQFQAHGAAVDEKNKRVYVADRGNEGGSGTVHVFSLEGKYLKSWDKPVPDFDPFTVRQLVKGIYIVPAYNDGAFYFFNADGKLLEKMDVHGDGPGQFRHAASVVADKDGFIYVPELAGNRIQKVDFRAEIERLKKKNVSTD